MKPFNLRRERIRRKFIDRAAAAPSSPMPAEARLSKSGIMVSGYFGTYPYLSVPFGTFLWDLP